MSRFGKSIFKCQSLGFDLRASVKEIIPSVVVVVVVVVVTAETKTLKECHLFISCSLYNEGRDSTRERYRGLVHLYALIFIFPIWPTSPSVGLRASVFERRSSSVGLLSLVFYCYVGL